MSRSPILGTPIAPRAGLARVGCGRLVRPQFFRAPRGYAASDGEYRSRFNFVWWFWLPRIHTQRPNSMNPRVLRIIWLCFAAGLEIYGPESRAFWPNKQI